MLKEITNHPNYYVSDDGCVFHNDKQLKPVKVGKAGYLTVNINGRRFMIHRLVAEAFLPNFDFSKQVHHKDMNVKNNKVSNLECLSQVDHMRLHRMKNPMLKRCLFCENVFNPHPTKRAVAKFCSRKCYLKYVRRNRTKAVI